MGVYVYLNISVLSGVHIHVDVDVGVDEDVVGDVDVDADVGVDVDIGHRAPGTGLRALGSVEYCLEKCGSCSLRATTRRRNARYDVCR